MKKLIGLFLAIALLVGCSGMQVTDEVNYQAMGYIGGKGMAIGIYKVSPKSAPVIEQAWMDMMGRCYGMAELPPSEMLGFFNSVLLKEIPTLTNDKYGLAGDLAFFATLYGAAYMPDGTMAGIKPIPMVVVKAFQAGYEGGRSVALSLK